MDRPESAKRVERGGAECSGAAVCTAVYGTQYEPLRSNIRALHPALERWMIEEGYGRVLGRPGVPLRIRELAIVAQLAVVGALPQLYSHLRGALRTGATQSQVEKALHEAKAWLTDAEWANVWDVWTGIQDRIETRKTI